MKFFNRSTVALLLIAGLILPLSIACERDQGPMEKLGENIDDAIDDVKEEGQDLGDKLEDAGEEIKDGAEDVEDEIDGQG